MTRIGGPRLPNALNGLRQTTSSQPGAKTEDSSKAQQSQAANASHTVQDTVATQAALAAELKKFATFIEAVQSDEQRPTSPPDFANMSQAEQYDYLHKLCVQQAAGDEAAWKHSEGEVNLIGIRHFSAGRLFASNLQHYCDSVLMARILDDKKCIVSFRAHLSPALADSAQNLGCGFYADDGNYVELPQLAPGFYRDAFVRVSGRDGEILLQQKGLLALQAQESKPKDADDSEKSRRPQARGTIKPMLIGPRWHAQFLAGRHGHRDDVAEPACQLIHPGDFKLFQQTLSQVPETQDLGMGGFSYLLFDGRDLPAVDADMVSLQKNQINARLVFQQSPDLSSQNIRAYHAQQSGDNKPHRKTKLRPKDTAQQHSLNLLSLYVKDGQ